MEIIRDKETGESEILQTVLTLDLDLIKTDGETHCTKCTNAVKIFKTRKHTFKIPKIYLNVHGTNLEPEIGLTANFTTNNFTPPSTKAPAETRHKRHKITSGICRRLRRYRRLRSLGLYGLPQWTTLLFVISVRIKRTIMKSFYIGRYLAC